MNSRYGQEPTGVCSQKRVCIENSFCSFTPFVLLLHLSHLFIARSIGYKGNFGTKETLLAKVGPSLRESDRRGTGQEVCIVGKTGQVPEVGEARVLTRIETGERNVTPPCTFCSCPAHCLSDGRKMSDFPEMLCRP